MAVKKKDAAEEVKPNYEGIPPEITKVTEELSTKLNDVEWNNRAKAACSMLTHSSKMLEGVKNNVRP